MSMQIEATHVSLGLFKEMVKLTNWHLPFTPVKCFIILYMCFNSPIIGFKILHMCFDMYSRPWGIKKFSNFTLY